MNYKQKLTKYKLMFLRSQGKKVRVTQITEFINCKLPLNRGVCRTPVWESKNCVKFSLSHKLITERLNYKERENIYEYKKDITVQ